MMDVYIDRINLNHEKKKP